jgi:hypothetical protein
LPRLVLPMRFAAGSAERSCCFTLRAVNRGSRRGSWIRPASRLRETERRAARLSLSVQRRRHCSASRLRNSRPQRRRPCRMPSGASGITRFAASPMPSPTLGFGAGKQKTVPSECSRFKPSTASLARLYLRTHLVRTAGLEPALSERNRFSYHFGFRRRQSAFVAWTVPSPWPLGRRRRPSSLYLPSIEGLARDWPGARAR